MRSKHVIDLLSSDEEAQLPAVSAAKAAVATGNGVDGGFVSLSNDSASNYDFDYDWPQQPSKRRKLSRSPVSEVGTYTLPTFSSARQRLPSHGLTTREGFLEDQADGSDPMDFTSSLGKITSRVKGRATHRAPSLSDLSDDSLPDNIVSASLRGKPSGLSVRTAALLDSLSQPPVRPKPVNARKRSADAPTKSRKGRSREMDDDRDSSGTEGRVPAPTKGRNASRKPKLKGEERAAKVREIEREKALKARERENAKAASREQKAKEKEDDHERRRALKEEKAREKRIAADLAEVNKSKLDKKDSTPEMIVDLPASIDGQSVHTQARQFLRNLDVDATLYQSPIPHVIKWRRKMKATWNAELDHWEPIEHMEIHEEKHIMCLMSAKEFISLAMVQHDDQDLETHVARLKSAYDGCTPVYLIEGLYIRLRKNKTAENRAYQAMVNAISQVDGTSSSQPASRRQKPATEIVDEDMIEDALLRLQVMHGCLVHHTSATMETAEWISNFTQHISTIPYRFVPMQ